MPDFAVGVALVSVVLAGLIAVAVWFAAGTLFPQPAARLAIALVPALLPIAPQEVSGNLANLHWYALWGGGWLLAARPVSRAAGVAAAAVVLVLALTEVQTLFLVPAAVLAFFSPPRRVVSLALVAGASAQWLTRHFAPPRGDYGGVPATISDLGVGFAGQVLAGSFWPRGLPLWQSWITLVLLGAWVLMLLATLRWARPVERAAVVVLAVASVGLYVLAIRLNRPRDMSFASWTESQWQDVGPARYATIPAAMVLVTVVLALTVWARRRPAAAAAVACMSTVVVVVGGLNSPTLRDTGPQWPTAEQWQRLCPEPSGVRVVTTPPLNAMSVWTVKVPCDRV